MTRHEECIRPANPIHEEGLKFAEYMDIASAGGFRTLFGKRYERIVSAVFLKPNHDLSYETARFAVREGKIIGMASGYSAVEFANFDQTALAQAAGPSAFRVNCACTLISPMLRFLHTYEVGDFYLQFLAVDKAARGQGIGTALIAAMETEAREKHATRLAIDVSARNPNARRLYERQGFARIASWPQARMLPKSVLRLVKDL